MSKATRFTPIDAANDNAVLLTEAARRALITSVIIECFHSFELNKLEGNDERVATFYETHATLSGQNVEDAAGEFTDEILKIMRESKSMDEVIGKARKSIFSSDQQAVDHVLHFSIQHNISDFVYAKLLKCGAATGKKEDTAEVIEEKIALQKDTLTKVLVYYAQIGEHQAKQIVRSFETAVDTKIAQVCGKPLG